MDCSIPDCGGRVTKRGLCNKHYLRIKRYGRATLLHPQKNRDVRNNCMGECRGAKRLRAHLDYLATQEKVKARGAKWRIDNKDRYQASKRRYLDDPDVQVKARERTMAWVRKNPDRKRAMDKAFNEANPSLVRSYKAARRARVIQATPAWLTEEHWLQIRSVYAEAERLTQETGIAHDVDHIVPLRGKTVCGLHVPWNLRTLPKTANNRRPRVWVPN